MFIADLASAALLGVGVLTALSPFALYWWIHGNDERYRWIISGPSPYDQFGGGPYQGAMYLSLLFFAAIELIVAVIWRYLIYRRRTN